MAYTRRYQIEFNHCDPAGIVFYPRYFELLNSMAENFFKDVLGRPFAQVVGEGNGSPTVRLEAQFRAPSRLGDLVDMAMQVRAVGRTSVDFHTTLRGADGGLRVEFDHRLVWTQGLTSTPWPEAMRTRLEAAMKEDTP